MVVYQGKHFRCIGGTVRQVQPMQRGPVARLSINQLMDHSWCDSALCMSAIITLNEPLGSLKVMFQPLRLSITSPAIGLKSTPSFRCQD